ncbi:MAG: glycosyltransferase family 2 protein [Pseudonocardia sp.]|nr:glycosyltransferase family 2 protein [Pseudonocardia sp.]
MTVTAVVTITHDRDAHLHRQRVGLAADPPDLHVVVGMGEAPRLTPVPDAPPVLLLDLPVPDSGLPLAAARNAGAAAALHAGADLLVLLDVDCIPAPRMLRRYRDAARTAAAPALLCGPVHYLPPPPPGGYPHTGLADLAPPHPARPAPPDGEVVPEDRLALFWSLSFAVTAATWTAAGGFCEEYTGYGGEDTDYALMAAAAGVGLHWVGGATAFHQHHPPARDTPARVAEIVRNATLFRRRNGWWPMTGWLTDLAARGAVEFDPGRDVLALPRPPPVSAPRVSGTPHP